MNIMTAAMKPFAIADELPPEEQRSRFYDAQYDFTGPTRLRKSYIVAATPRCGSNLLCNLMWQSGLLGAPAEYWNYIKRQAPKQRIIGTGMMERLEAISPLDYIAKLVACRTSKNGVFGVKLLFRRFQQSERGLLPMMEFLENAAPLHWIYIVRSDPVAQAVSLAKGLQTGVFTSRRQQEIKEAMPVDYDKDLIGSCLAKIEAQNLGWRTWFRSKNIEPYVVDYEKLAADNAGTLARICEYLGVQNDEPDKVIPRATERQSDSTNKEWTARFRSDQEAEAKAGANGATRRKQPRTIQATDDSSRFFDKRRRDRCKVIISANRALLKDARVLDVYCGRGDWSLAALEAGARRVVGLDTRRRPIDKANTLFAKRGIKTDAYQFLQTKIPGELEYFDPETFDVVVCEDFSALGEPYYFFEQLRRLRPRHVIVDTAISPNRKQPAAFFKLAFFRFGGADGEPLEDAKRPLASVVAVPNHELFEMLCEHFGFAWRLIDWTKAGISNWAGLDDYQDKRRQSYVFTRP